MNVVTIVICLPLISVYALETTTTLYAERRALRGIEDRYMQIRKELRNNDTFDTLLEKAIEIARDAGMNVARLMERESGHQVIHDTIRKLLSGLRLLYRAEKNKNFDKSYLMQCDSEVTLEDAPAFVGLKRRSMRELREYRDSLDKNSKEYQAVSDLIGDMEQGTNALQKYLCSRGRTAQIRESKRYYEAQSLQQMLYPFRFSKICRDNSVTDSNRLRDTFRDLIESINAVDY